MPESSVMAKKQPRRFLSLPGSLLELKKRNAGGIRLDALSDNALHRKREVLDEEIHLAAAGTKCISRISARGTSRAEVAAVRTPGGVEGVSTTEEVLIRACRLRVNIVAAKCLKRTPVSKLPKVVTMKVRVEERSQLSKEVGRCVFWSGSEEIVQQKQLRIGGLQEDGSFKVNQSFTFDIKNPKRAILTVEVLTRTRFTGEQSLGICQEIFISDLLEKSTGENEPAAKWHDLFSRRGKQMPGKILLDTVAGIADPEHQINLFLGSWNVGNARPPDNLSSWLSTGNKYELVIVGAQECDYPPRQPFNECAKDWINSLRSCVGGRYKLICATSRGQIRLAVFVRDDAEKAISEIDSGSEATGVGHVMANKGAVGISFKFWDTDLCFVNSHFAAHMGYCDVRNSNYKEIVENLSVGYQAMNLISKFHHVFWMGDLNYRLDFGIAEEKSLSPQKGLWQLVVNKIENAEYEDLLHHDELGREIVASRAFHGFKEGKITFAPTFKMLRGSSSSYAEKRLPAWCDRILWRSLKGCDAKLCSYSSHPQIDTSDHKPVAATFSLTAYALPCSRSNQDERRWHIKFTSLEACNLRSSDINGFSDPYISFLGENLVIPSHSRVKFRTLNPVWDPSKDLPNVVLVATSLQRLEHEYLMCHVLDYDFASANDTLGFGVIPLGPAVAAFRSSPEASAAFQIELLHRGLPAGVLKGTMKLVWQRNLLKQKSSIAGSFLVRTLTFRKSFKKALFAKHHF